MTERQRNGPCKLPEMAYLLELKGAYSHCTQTKIKSSHMAFCREFAYDNMMDKLLNSKEDKSVCNL